MIKRLIVITAFSSLSLFSQENATREVRFVDEYEKINNDTGAYSYPCDSFKKRHTNDKCVSDKRSISNKIVFDDENTIDITPGNSTTILISFWTHDGAVRAKEVLSKLNFDSITIDNSHFFGVNCKNFNSYYSKGAVCDTPPRTVYIHTLDGRIINLRTFIDEQKETSK